MFIDFSNLKITRLNDARNMKCRQFLVDLYFSWVQQKRLLNNIFMETKMNVFHLHWKSFIGSK